MGTSTNTPENGLPVVHQNDLLQTSLLLELDHLFVVSFLKLAKASQGVCRINKMLRASLFGLIGSQTSKVDAALAVLPYRLVVWLAEFPNVDGGIPARADKPGVVIKPGNAADSAVMTFEDLGILREVKLVDLNCRAVGSSEQVPSMRKLNLTAQLNLDVLVGHKIFLKQIHHADAFVEANHQVEARRVERDAVGLFLEVLVDFEIEAVGRRVGPNFDSAVYRSCSDEGLLNAGIHAVDLACVERQN